MSYILGNQFQRVHAKLLQLCVTLCDPMDCSLPDFLHPWYFPGKSAGVGAIASPFDERSLNGAYVTVCSQTLSSGQ